MEITGKVYTEVNLLEVALLWRRNLPRGPVFRGRPTLLSIHRLDASPRKRLGPGWPMAAEVYCPGQLDEAILITGGEDSSRARGGI